MTGTATIFKPIEHGFMCKFLYLCCLRYLGKHS
jgi:hypothetical protein